MVKDILKIDGNSIHRCTVSVSLSVSVLQLCIMLQLLKPVKYYLLQPLLERCTHVHFFLTSVVLEESISRASLSSTSVEVKVYVSPIYVHIWSVFSFIAFLHLF